MLSFTDGGARDPVLAYLNDDASSTTTSVLETPSRRRRAGVVVAESPPTSPLAKRGRRAEEHGYVASFDGDDRHLCVSDFFTAESALLRRATVVYCELRSVTCVSFYYSVTQPSKRMLWEPLMTRGTLDHCTASLLSRVQEEARRSPHVAVKATPLGLSQGRSPFTAIASNVRIELAPADRTFVARIDVKRPLHDSVEMSLRWDPDGDCASDFVDKDELYQLSLLEVAYRDYVPPSPVSYFEDSE